MRRKRPLVLGLDLNQARQHIDDGRVDLDRHRYPASCQALPIAHHGQPAPLALAADAPAQFLQCAFTRNLIVLNWWGCPQTVERDDKCGIVQDG
jgi:hypothetical protein